MAESVRVAVVGSGPSGFYAADALLGLRDVDAWVDMYDRLPTPWGLVRAGVAPDHPKIKTVASVFEKTAAHERFRFFGNVEIGRHIQRSDLLDHYDIVVYATGAQADRGLGIPGEDLPGSTTASAFVGWYNGHPDYAEHRFELTGHRAVVVGNGNVALDVARILITPPDRLATTDIADHALAALRTSSIREVLVVGRRGPAQAAFTTPELHELRGLTGAAVHVEPPEILDEPDPEKMENRVRRNLGVLRDYRDSALTDGDQESGDDHGSPGSRIVLRFCCSPIELRGDGRVEQVVLGTNVLQTGTDGSLRAVDTGEREIVDATMVITCIGYKAEPLGDLAHDAAAGTVAHDNCRVRGSDREYVVGWVKRGATGVIGTNKKCANETVARIVADLGERMDAGEPSVVGDRAATIEEWLRTRQPDLVTALGWHAIDAAERAAGQLTGRPRVKQCTYAELIATATEA